MEQAVYEKIKQRRYQILVHSLIYYELDINLISDDKWIEWAKELVYLQNSYPEESKKATFYEQFKEFDGSTGFDLPYFDEQIVNITIRLLSNNNLNNIYDKAIYKLKNEIKTTASIYKREIKRKPIL